MGKYIKKPDGYNHGGKAFDRYHLISLNQIGILRSMTHIGDEVTFRVKDSDDERTLVVGKVVEKYPNIF